MSLSRTIKFTFHCLGVGPVSLTVPKMCLGKRAIDISVSYWPYFSNMLRLNMVNDPGPNNDKHKNLITLTDGRTLVVIRPLIATSIHKIFRARTPGSITRRLVHKRDKHVRLSRWSVFIYHGSTQLYAYRRPSKPLYGRYTNWRPGAFN